MLGINTGDDDFAAPQIERELAAGIDAERLPDGLGQRDLAFRGQRGDFVDGRHGDSPDCDTCMVRKFPYFVNLRPHSVLPSPRIGPS